MKNFIIKTTSLIASAVLLFITPFTAMAASNPAINASVLPSSRTTTVGAQITIFATIANSGAGAATSCSIGAKDDTNNGGPNPVGLSVSYRAYQSDNVTPAAAPNTPIDIAAGANQAFVVSIAGSSPFNQEIQFNFSCNTGNVTAPTFSGVNTLLLLNATSAVPDIITIGTSPSADAVIRIPSLGAGEIMAVAALNIGAATSGVIVVPDFGEYDLALDAFICETNPATAICLAPYAKSVSTNVGASASTFNIFVNSTLGAGVPLYADIARQFIRFYQDTTPSPTAEKGLSKPASSPPANSGLVYGATSHAVTSPGPLPGGAVNTPDGIWNAVFDSTTSTGEVIRNEGVVVISVEGEWSALIFGTEAGDVFQFGSIAADETITPDPTMAVEFRNFEEDLNAMDGSMIENRYRGNGTWQPNSFIFGSVTFTPPPPAASKDKTAEPAVTLQRPAAFKATYSPVYDRTVTFADLTGNYDVIEEDENGVVSNIGSVNFANDGTFSGIVTPEPGETCNASGSLTENGNNKNLFGVSMTVTGCVFADTFLGQGFQLDETFSNIHVTDVFRFLALGTSSDSPVLITLTPKASGLFPL
ncbi:MAG: hypothetical protein JKY46_07060 [Robiginitomaculum sp.]|nr:hypothetical protein [Robiginitomaculum sp.]